MLVEKSYVSRNIGEILPITWNLVEILWFIFKYFSAQFMAQFSSFLLTFRLVKSQTQSLKQISLNLL